MAQRIHRTKSKGIRPTAEGLETRQLLSAQVTGTDIDGDTWVLDLQGPGDLSVFNQDGADGLPVPLGTPALIKEIKFTGTAPLSSKLVGAVTKGPNGDGRVYFANITQFGGDSLTVPGSNGLRIIDMPDFWMGDTDPTSTDTTRGTISIPDGVVSLRFGGVDTTAFFGTTDSQRLDRNNRSDRFLVNLGLPAYAGTTILVDTVTTSGQAAATSTGDPTQDTVTFSVQGRLNTFQANAILGNAEVPANPFARDAGTIVNAIPVASDDNSGTLAGQIGDVRVGGEATNFFATSTGLISNFYVGGETNHVSLQSPDGTRNVVFGRGMDVVNIDSHVIQFLSANRGAINSRVSVTRDIGRVTIGGDMINTQILSGYNVLGDTIQAGIGGKITASVAGDMKNSVFAASVEPADGITVDPDTGEWTAIFGGRDDLYIPQATIDLKVEGSIDNTELQPDKPNQGAFAEHVRLERGPVIPPAVPEPPFEHLTPLRKTAFLPQKRNFQVRPPSVHVDRRTAHARAEARLQNRLNGWAGGPIDPNVQNVSASASASASAASTTSPATQVTPGSPAPTGRILSPTSSNAGSSSTTPAANTNAGWARSINDLLRVERQVSNTAQTQADDNQASIWNSAGATSANQREQAAARREEAAVRRAELLARRTQAAPAAARDAGTTSSPVVSRAVPRGPLAVQQLNSNS